MVKFGSKVFLALGMTWMKAADFLVLCLDLNEDSYFPLSKAKTLIKIYQGLAITLFGHVDRTGSGKTD